MDDTTMVQMIAELERLKKVERLALALAAQVRRTVDERPHPVSYGFELYAFSEELGYIEEEAR